MGIIKKIGEIIKDPILCCGHYKKFGCCHVDGLICDTNTCNWKINHERISNSRKKLETTKLRKLHRNGSFSEVNK